MKAWQQLGAQDWAQVGAVTSSETETTKIYTEFGQWSLVLRNLRAFGSSKAKILPVAYQVIAAGGGQVPQYYQVM